RSDGGTATFSNAWQPLTYLGFPNRWCESTTGGYWAFTIDPRFEGTDNLEGAYGFGVRGWPYGAGAPDAGLPWIAFLQGDTTYDPFPICGAAFSTRTYGPCQPQCPAGDTVNDVFMYGHTENLASAGSEVGCVSSDGRTKQEFSVYMQLIEYG